MLNYNLTFTIADIARILKVDREIVKTWAYKFSEYLSPGASPSKGSIRKFTIEDIRIIAFVYTLWEDNPDIEYIKIGLNSNGQFENPLIDDLIVSLIPIFTDPPEDLDECYKYGVIFSGLAAAVDIITHARSYKLAGDRLVEIALKNEEAVDLFHPAMFNYRHSIELYLKALTGKNKQRHDLLYFFYKLDEQLKQEFNAKSPKWVVNIITGFDEVDPGSTTFRYGEGHEKDEVFVDFIQLKTLMGWLAKYFQNILYKRGITL